MYQTITTRFQEYKHSAKKKCKCSVCGKTFTRQRTFTATQNPWNKDEQGQMKSSREIYACLEKEAGEWMLKQEEHGCKNKSDA